MEQVRRLVINSAGAPQPLGAYSQAVRVHAREFLYIAGQVALEANGNLVGRGDAGAQTKQVFHNIGQILDRSGATFRNVVEFTTYLVGREAIQPFLNARTELFSSLYPEGDYPPNTLLIVNGLVREEFLVEIKAVAALA